VLPVPARTGTEASQGASRNLSERHLEGWACRTDWLRPEIGRLQQSVWAIANARTRGIPAAWQSRGTGYSISKPEV